MRHIIRDLGMHLPQSKRDDPEVKGLVSYGCATVMHVMPLLVPRVDGEDHTKDIDFSPAGVRARWQAGLVDTRRRIEQAPWRSAVDLLDRIVIHEESSPEPVMS